MKLLFSLVILGAVAFCAIKIAPTYIENYELQDYISQVAAQANVQPAKASPGAIRNEILAKAESLGLPVGRQNIKVSVGKTVRIKLDYSVYVDLSFYMLTLHFSPSAHSKIT